MSAEETAHSGPISAVTDRRYISAVTDRRYNSTWSF